MGDIMDHVKEILLTEEYVGLLSEFKKKYGYTAEGDLPPELLGEFSREIAERLVNRIFVDTVRP